MRKKKGKTADIRNKKLPVKHIVDEINIGSDYVTWEDAHDFDIALEAQTDFDIEKCIDAAKTGDVSAQMDIARFYYYENNYDKSIRCFYVAYKNPLIDENDKTICECFLGDIFGHKAEIEYDSKKYYHLSAKWYLKAAKKGHNSAQHQCSEYYRQGTGFTRNYSKAFEWAFKAACTNVEFLIQKVAEYYEKGIGTEEDRIEAYIWYVMGLASKLKLESMESELSREVVLKAQQEADIRNDIMDKYEEYDIDIIIVELKKREFILSPMGKKVQSKKTSMYENNDDQNPSNEVAEDIKPDADLKHYESSLSSKKQPRKLHRSGIDLSSWEVQKVSDITLVFYLKDANITLSDGKHKPKTESADVFFSKNSLRLLIIFYDQLNKGASPIKYKAKTIAQSAKKPDDIDNTELENHRVVTYFNGDFRQLFGLDKKDQAFEWTKGKLNKNLTINFELKVK